MIRNKPENVPIESYVKLIQANFTASYKKNSDQIVELKQLLLEAKKQIFMLTIKPDPFGLEDNKTKFENYLKNLELSEQKALKCDEWQKTQCQFGSNIEFMSNVVKLKSVQQSFRLNESDKEVILECLVAVLNQVKCFILSSSNKKASNDPNFLPISFPFESILHSVQLFLNVFEIEWLYYLRHRLVDPIVDFIDELVAFILNNTIHKKVSFFNFFFFFLFNVNLKTFKGRNFKIDRFKSNFNNSFD